MNGQVRLSLSRVICMVLLILVLVPLVTHYYLSKVTNDTSVQHVRPQLEAEEFNSLKTSDLKMRIEEMLRIKASVSTELRELEAKRRKIQQILSNYSQSVEELKIEKNKQQSELNRLKVSVEQAKVAQKEAAQRNMPELLAPKRILPSFSEKIAAPAYRHISQCRLHLCFDYSRCSLTSGFPVYIYNPDIYQVGQPLDNYLKTTLLQTLRYNPHVTNNPIIACVYLVIAGDISNDNQLTQLPHWNGDGRNHIILNAGYDFITGVNTGRAIIASVQFTSELYRLGFDMIIPPAIGPPGGDVWVGAPIVVPARRKYLLYFHGEYLYSQPDANINSVSIDMTMVQLLKKLQFTATEDKFKFTFNCIENRVDGLQSEWSLCESELFRAKQLEEATYSLILAPSNQSLISTQLTVLRLQESLKFGAIPVILGSQLALPFHDVIDWKRAVIFLPKARITELHFFLRSITDNDLLTLRRQGRFIWERYLASVQGIVDTTIAVLRDRIGIPPLPAEEEPSPSIFNNSFVPLKSESISPEAELDESFGPSELPYASPEYQRNYTTSRLQNYLMWNDWADPFRLYPYLPFDPLLPSEAKFNGSEIGFRPIGYGSGGSGKEFSESLGGNSPREQFTIVMLTYEREQVLMDSLARLYGLPYLNKVVVVWNAPKLPAEDLRWPDIGVPIHVVKAARNSLNNRFLPYSAIETEAVLSVDDDAHLRHDEIIFGFRVWRENRERLVGFPGRYHAWDLKHGGWLYNSNYSCELSMVLTGAAFFHKYYAYLYSYTMPQAIRDKVDEYMNCEDIAMNFLVAHIVRKPPVKVTSRWTFRCPGCPVSLSEEDSHFHERHKCINFFTQVYGYTPLLNTQFRADSILFKTRIPHDKQKCFKFI